jgi:hypothetical protein
MPSLDFDMAHISVAPLREGAIDRRPRCQENALLQRSESHHETPHLQVLGTTRAGLMRDDGPAIDYSAANRSIASANDCVQECSHLLLCENCVDGTTVGHAEAPG